MNSVFWRFFSIIAGLFAATSIFTFLASKKLTSKVKESADWLIETTYLFFVDIVIFLKPLKKYRKEVGVALWLFFVVIIGRYLVVEQPLITEIKSPYLPFIGYIYYLSVIYLIKFTLEFVEKKMKKTSAIHLKKGNPMKKIDKRIQEVLAKGEKVLVSGVPVGYPSLADTLKIVGTYIKSGIDVVEFSMPTRDPYIDTKTIADSNIKALDLQPDLEQYFEVLHSVRKEYPDEPFYMMAYADLIQEYGVEKFVDQLVELEIDGVELPDKDEKVPELAAKLEALFDEKGIYRIYFIQHPFNQKNFDAIKDKAKGFVILQAVAISEGKRPKVAPENEQLTEKVRAGLKAPVIFGYGINNAERVKEAVALDVDGVLVGTAMVEYITKGDLEAFSKFIQGLKEATRLK